MVTFALTDPGDNYYAIVMLTPPMPSINYCASHRGHFASLRSLPCAADMDTPLLSMDLHAVRICEAMPTALSCGCRFFLSEEVP